MSRFLTSSKNIKLGIISALLFFTTGLLSQTVTSVQTGPWNDDATWDIGIPQAGEDVIIDTGDEVTVDGNTSAIASLTINGSMLFESATGSYTVDIDGNLTNNGSINLDEADLAAHTIEIFGNFSNNGTFTASGSGPDFIYVDFNGTGSMAASGAISFYRLIQSGSGDLSTGSSVVTVLNRLDLQAGTFTVGSGGLIIEAGTVNINGSGFDATTNNSTITFQGSSAPSLTVNGTNISPLIFYNLVVKDQDLTLSATGADVAFTINNNLTLTDQNLVIGSAGETIAYGNGASLVYNGSARQFVDIEWTDSVGPDNVTVNNATGVTISTGALSLDGNLTLTNGELAHSGTLTVNGNVIGGSGSYGQKNNGTLLLNGNSSSEVTVSSALSLHNLTINKTNGAGVLITVQNGASINTDTTATLTITQGTLAFSQASQLNLGPTNTLSISANGTLRTGGTSIAGFASKSLNAGSTIDFSGSNSETVPAGSYGNITVSNNNATGVTLGAGITLNSTLTVNSGSRLNLGGFTITHSTDALNVGGTLYTDGSSIVGFGSYTIGGTLIFNGSSQETLPSGITANNITVNNVNGLVLAGTGRVNGTLTFSNGKITSTASNLLTLGATATATPTSNNFVLGPVARATNGSATSFAFPVGIGSNLRSVVLDFVSAPANSNTITARAFGSVSNPTSGLGGVSSVENDGYWQITSTEGSPPNYTATLTTTNFSPAISGASNVSIVRGSAADTYDDELGANESPGTDQIAADFTGGFSYFAVATLSGTITWKGGSGNWSTGTNWFGDVSPGNGDNVVISSSGSNVTYDVSVDPSSISLSGGVTLNFSSGSIDFATNSLAISAGNGDKITYGSTTISNYDNTSTDYQNGSTVQYNTGTANADNYGNLIVNYTGGAGSSDGDITLTGDLTNNGTQSFSAAGTVTMNGSLAQTISGSGTTSFTNLTINNSGGVNVNQTLTVNGTLTLTAGIVENGSNVITVDGISGGSSTAFVSGPLARTSATGSTTFPIGESNYRPIISDFSGTSPTVLFQVFDSAPNQSLSGLLSTISTVRYFYGEVLSGSITGGSFTITYGEDDGVTNFNDSTDVVVAWSSDNSTYSSLGGPASGTTGEGTITFPVSVDPDLGYFTLGSETGDNALPVELISFDVQPDYDKVIFEWQTASESNNQGFNIKRKLTELDDWEFVNTELINGQGNSSSAAAYRFVDREVVSGKNYSYKLESVSYNGLIVTEKSVDVSIPLPQEFVLFDNYPNPFNPMTTLTFQIPEQSTVTLIVYNIKGQAVKEIVKNAAYQAGQYSVNWDATDNFGNKVSSGMYIYKFSANNFEKLGKMILMK